MKAPLILGFNGISLDFASFLRVMLRLRLPGLILLSPSLLNFILFKTYNQLPSGVFIVSFLLCIAYSIFSLLLCCYLLIKKSVISGKPSETTKPDDVEIKEIETRTEEIIKNQECIKNELFRDILIRACSKESIARFKAQTTMQQADKQKRKLFLRAMQELAKSNNHRIRAEGYYCLGNITVNGQSYLLPEAFFYEGLNDKSDWVKACCAHALQNCIPLAAETVSKLNTLLFEIDNCVNASVSEDTERLRLYASRTLSIDSDVRELSKPLQK